MASAAVIVVPGAATLFVGAKAQAGPLHAMAGAAGIVLGDVILMSASGLGLSSLVTRWPMLLAAIRLLGASYIGWMGLSLIRSGEPQLQPDQRAHVDVADDRLLVDLATHRAVCGRAGCAAAR